MSFGNFKVLLEGNEKMSEPSHVGHYRLHDFILLVLFPISLFVLLRIKV